MKHPFKVSRRFVLRGAAGATMALPLLDSLMGPRKAVAAEEGVPPFAIFVRQPSGVATATATDIGSEPERFWPTEFGPLQQQTMSGRAVDELLEHASRLLIVGNVDMEPFDYGDGHARGALQGLTAQGPTVLQSGLSAEAAGESLDNRIGRELNPDGRDSMFLYVGAGGGSLGGPCISYRGAENRRAPLHDPINAYQAMMGLDADLFGELIARQRSVNDLVREEVQALLSRSEMGTEDRRRLDLHMTSIRDLETELLCNLSKDHEAALAGEAPGYESTDGDEVMIAARAHARVAALAVACGYTRSVALQVTDGSGRQTRYWDPTTGLQMENYHYISHRLLSHGGEGEVIPNADVLHHQVDRQFAQLFKFLLDRLTEYEMPDGSRLVDCGVSVWYNDLGSGPGHSFRNIPYVLAGSAGGFFRQGQYVQANTNGGSNHARMLNTIGSAAGLRKANGDFLDNFGDPSLQKGLLDELLA